MKYAEYRGLLLTQATNHADFASRNHFWIIKSILNFEKTI